MKKGPESVKNSPRTDSGFAVWVLQKFAAVTIASCRMLFSGLLWFSCFCVDAMAVLLSGVYVHSVLPTSVFQKLLSHLEVPSLSLFVATVKEREAVLAYKP